MTVCKYRFREYFLNDRLQISFTDNHSNDRFKEYILNDRLQISFTDNHSNDRFREYFLNERLHILREQTSSEQDGLVCAPRQPDLLRIILSFS